MVKLSSLVDYLDGYLSVPDHPDYRTALNGLQVQGREEVKRVAASVDTSEAVIADATAAKADLLLVHHGLFWDGLRPLTGRRFRKVQALMKAGTALYRHTSPSMPIPRWGTASSWPEPWAWR